MKSTYILAAVVAALFLSMGATAQIPGVHKITKQLPKVQLGLKLGANFQDLNGSSTIQNSYKGGVLVGAFVNVRKNKWGVQAEALFKTVSYSFQGGGNINSAYLDVPVLLEYRLVPRLWLQVGPQFSDILSAKSGSTSVISTFKSTDFSGVIGLQAILPVHFVAGARYVLGLTNVNNTGVDGTWNNRSFQLYLGWRLL